MDMLLTTFDENLIAFHMKRTKLKFDKPVYFGMSILDLSKSLMYVFDYNYILPKYGKNPNCYSLIRIPYAMKLKQKIFSKTFLEMLKQNTSNFEKKSSKWNSC